MPLCNLMDQVEMKCKRCILTKVQCYQFVSSQKAVATQVSIINTFSITDRNHLLTSTVILSLVLLLHRASRTLYFTVMNLTMYCMTSVSLIQLCGLSTSIMTHCMTDGILVPLSQPIFGPFCV